MSNPVTPMPVDLVTDFIIDLLAPAMHKKRALSLAQAAVGTMHAQRLSVSDVGRAIGRAYGTSGKHGIKQVDRLLSNSKVELNAIYSRTVPWLVGRRRRIAVSLDWTEYDKDSHSRIAINLVTNHGRATPLVWKTVRSTNLKHRRNEYEDEAIETLAEHLPKGVKVILLADRGFGDTKLYRELDELGWDFVIRFRESIYVDVPGHPTARARDLVAKNGRIRGFPDACVTRSKFPVGVVTVKRKRMKEAWCLATTMARKPAEVVDLYRRRFTCEESFRDEKDILFGFGALTTRFGEPARRDRFLAVLMLATIALTILGKAGENAGCDKMLRSNTITDRRTHSLIRQGREYIRGIASHAVAEVRSEFTKIIESHSSTTRMFSLL